MNRLLSLNFWVTIFSVLATLGVVLTFVGTLAKISWVRTAGFVLIAPLMIGGLAIALIVLPILVVVNWKRKQRERVETGMSRGNR